jgi:hypothetical protein
LEGLNTLFFLKIWDILMGSKKDKEYGVVLKRNKKFRFKIFPQKGKIPKEEDETYKIV